MTILAQPSAPQRRIVTTEELRGLLVAGKKVRLRPVVRPAAAALAHYGQADLDDLEVAADGAVVSSVEHVRDEQVQCIAVDHPDHLYLTDGFIPTHNTSNIVFLKSTDDSMIETLEKMSGKRHRAYTDSKTVTKDTKNVFTPTSVEGKVSYTMAVKEEPVISYNDLAFISERNSIVFRAGDSPVWNRNETVLPMSWRLFRDDIVHAGHDYTLQTIPTLSTALDFDVRMNQPDFQKMLAKRMEQAEQAVNCKVIYQNAYDYTDFAVSKLDPDVYSDDVMELVDSAMREELAEEQGWANADEVNPEDIEGAMHLNFSWEEDMAMQQIMIEEKAKRLEFEKKIYAEGQISRDMLVHINGGALVKSLDMELIEAYKAARGDIERDRMSFSVGGDGSLRSADGSEVYISMVDESDSMRQMQAASVDAGSRVFSEGDAHEGERPIDLGFVVHGEFYEFLASLPSWLDLAGGEFDRAVAQAMRLRDSVLLSS